MKTTIIRIRGTFCGLYNWGSGWVSSEVAEKWDAFWEGLTKSDKSIFWRYAPPRDRYCSCGYLCSSDGTVYLHPMDFETVLSRRSGTALISENGNSYNGAFKSELQELQRLCSQAAKSCGGTFSLEAGRETLIDAGDVLPFDPDHYGSRHSFPSSI